MEQRCINRNIVECKANCFKCPSLRRPIVLIEMILSILVDTFISKISLTMQPGPKIDSISGA